MTRTSTQSEIPASDGSHPHGSQRQCVACGLCVDCQINGCVCDWDGAEQW